MSNKIKVAGYTKKVEYEGEIEYRNFSDGLVGNQFSSKGDTPLFTGSNFNVSTNLDPKDTKVFTTNSFGGFVDLDSLKVDEIEINEIITQNSEVKINFDKTEISNYAYFGSFREYVRISLEKIINNWPASIYVSSVNPFDPLMVSPTFFGVVYASLSNETKFIVNSDIFNNKFNINFLKSGNVVDKFTDGDDLKNFTVNFKDYVIDVEGIEYEIIGFIPATTNSNVVIKVKGKPFDFLPNTTAYHIKPNKYKIEKFFYSLNDLESNLLNRLTVPKYTSKYKYSVESENGNVISTSTSLTWPVSDGYNIDFQSESYVKFVSKLLEIAENNDLVKSDLVNRFLVSDSITEFDTESEKMGKTLKIYGREFDEVKKYIDGISYANTVTYDKIKNTPDTVIKNLAKVMGWDLVSSLNENELFKDFLVTGDSTFEGHSRGLTLTEAEIQLWSRLIMNTPWIWKAKGTRKVIEFLFKFIGSPDGLVLFNEFVYVGKSQMNMNEFIKVFEKNVGYTNISGLNVDSKGFPTILPNSPEMYFQKGGLWYRETSGPNANIDILTGNNPHVGPYDAGSEYISQFQGLIPDFSPVMLIEETVNTEEVNLFSNYNSGTFNGIYDGNVVLDVNTDIDFNQVILNNLTQEISGLQIVTKLNECSATMSWNLKVKLNDVIISDTIFGSDVVVENGVISSNTLEVEFLSEMAMVNTILNQLYAPIEMIDNGGSIRFVELVDNCNGTSFYAKKSLNIELCLNMIYDCGRGDCELGSLIVNGMDPVTGKINFDNVNGDVVPNSGCCTNLGYSATAVTGGFNCYGELPEPYNNDTTFYLYIDTTSVDYSDAVIARNKVYDFVEAIRTSNPSFVGELFVIPVDNGRYVKNASRPLYADSSNLVNTGAWASLVNLPTYESDNVIVITLVNNVNEVYHSEFLSQGFTNPSQPTTQFMADYNEFVSLKDEYVFSKFLVYPIVPQYDPSVSGISIIIQGLAALEARLIPSIELPSTNVDVSVLMIENPYSGVITPLRELGFRIRLNKELPSAQVYNSQEFTDDLNDFLNNVQWL